MKLFLNKTKDYYFLEQKNRLLLPKHGNGAQGGRLI